MAIILHLEFPPKTFDILASTSSRQKRRTGHILSTKQQGGPGTVARIRVSRFVSFRKQVTLELFCSVRWCLTSSCMRSNNSGSSAGVLCWSSTASVRENCRRMDSSRTVLLVDNGSKTIKSRDITNASRCVILFAGDHKNSRRRTPSSTRERLRLAVRENKKQARSCWVRWLSCSPVRQYATSSSVQ